MPDGNALTSILTSWFHSLQTKGILELKLSSDSPDLTQYVQGEIFKVCDHLRGSVHGFDFAKALYSYYTGYRTLDDELQSDALRWLRGEYEGKVQSRSSRVQINSVIDDHNWYDYLKLYALFFRQIGYAGLCVFFDECVNLYKISNRVSRENNYEKILAMFNDTMQGKAEGLGFFLGATPQLIEDNRRGLFSYEALKSRLIPGKFVNSEKQNLLSPLIYLDRLTDNQIFALCKRLSILHSTYYNYTASVDDRNIASFLQLSFNRMGADEMITPREITRDFLNVLDILYSSPETSFEELVLSQDNENTKKDDDSKEDDYFDFTEIQL